MGFIEASWIEPKWWDILVALEVGSRDYQAKRAKRPPGSTQAGVTDMRPSAMRNFIEKMKNKEKGLK
jgi:hypothetical protein